MQTIIGITGAIGSGKTTLSDLLTQIEPSHAHYESREIITEVANVFNRLLAEAVQTYRPAKIGIEEINNLLETLAVRLQPIVHTSISSLQLEIIPADTLNRPELYEKLFTYIADVQKNHRLLEQDIAPKNKPQYRALLQWLGGYMNAKVSPTLWFDEIFRRVEERDADKKLVIVAGIRYPSDASVVKKHGGVIVEIIRNEPAADATDITERERKNIAVDIQIMNNGTLEELAEKANKLYQTLKS